MSSLRLALKQSLEEAGGGGGGGSTLLGSNGSTMTNGNHGKKKKKKKSSSTTTTATAAATMKIIKRKKQRHHPDDPPRKRGRPRKHPLPTNNNNNNSLADGSAHNGEGSQQLQQQQALPLLQDDDDDDDEDDDESSDENEFSDADETESDDDDDDDDDDSDDDDDDDDSQSQTTSTQQVLSSSSSSFETKRAASTSMISADIDKETHMTGEQQQQQQQQQDNRDTSIDDEERARRKQRKLQKKLKQQQRQQNSAAHMIQNHWKRKVMKHTNRKDEDDNGEDSSSTRGRATAQNSNVTAVATTSTTTTNVADSGRRSKSPPRKSLSPLPGSNKATSDDKAQTMTNTSKKSHSSTVTKSSNKRDTVPAPAPEIIAWMEQMSMKKQRRSMSAGLRVKVRFATKVKKRQQQPDNNNNSHNKSSTTTVVVRKYKWYGGLVTAMSASGSKIRIKYDDGTSEVTKFPDKDIVVDDEDNDEHQVPADAFIPPPPEEEDDDDDEDTDIDETGMSLLEDTPDRPRKIKKLKLVKQVPPPLDEDDDEEDSADEDDADAENKDKGSSTPFNSIATATNTTNVVTTTTTTNATITSPPPTSRLLSMTSPTPPADASCDLSEDKQDDTTPQSVRRIHELTEDTGTVDENTSEGGETTKTMEDDVHPQQKLSYPRDDNDDNDDDDDDPDHRGNGGEGKQQQQHPLKKQHHGKIPTEISHKTTTDGKLHHDEDDDHDNPDDDHDVKVQQQVVVQDTTVTKPTVVASVAVSSTVEKAAEATPLETGFVIAEGKQQKTLVTKSPTMEVPQKATESKKDSLEIPILPQPTTEVKPEAPLVPAPASLEDDNSDDSSDDDGPMEVIAQGSGGGSGGTEILPPKTMPLLIVKGNDNVADEDADAEGDDEANEYDVMEMSETDADDHSPDTDTGDEDDKSKDNGRPTSFDKEDQRKEEKAFQGVKQNKKDQRMKEKQGLNPMSSITSKRDMRLNQEDSDDVEMDEGGSEQDIEPVEKVVKKEVVQSSRTASEEDDDDEEEEESLEPPTKRMKGSSPTRPRSLTLKLSIPNALRRASTPTATLSEFKDEAPKKEIKKPVSSIAKSMISKEVDQPDKTNSPKILSSKNSAFEKKEKVAREKKEKKNSAEVPSEEELMALTPHQDKFDMSGVSRSGRRAAQQANERIASRQEMVIQDQFIKPKKKRGEKVEKYIDIPVVKDKKRKEIDDGEKTIEKAEDENQWVQCDKCSKWRVLPPNVDVDTLPNQWYCEMNVHDPLHNDCDAAEQTPQEIAKAKRKAKRRQARRARLEAEAAAAAAATATSTSDDPEPKRRAKSPSAEKRELKTKEKIRSNESGKKRSSPDSNNELDDDGVNSLRSDSGSDQLKESKKARRSKPPDDDTTAIDGDLLETMKAKQRGRNRRPGKEGKEDKGKGVKGTEENQEEWVQCEKCEKWRRLPPHVSADDLPEVWYCSMNTWDPNTSTCHAAEDKADPNAQPIASPFAGHGGHKLSYRSLIFGTGKKQNRPISERMRAAESLFSTHDPEVVGSHPTVMYAHSKMFVNRSNAAKLAEERDAEKSTFLELMSHSNLWAELRRLNKRMNQQAKIASARQQTALLGANHTYSALSQPLKTEMKEMIFHSLGNSTMESHEVLLEAQCRPWEGVPEVWADLRVICTIEAVASCLLELVKEGRVEVISAEKSRSSGLLLETAPKFRRVQRDRETTTNNNNINNNVPSIQPSRCMKISKPWKKRRMELGS